MKKIELHTIPRADLYAPLFAFTKDEIREHKVQCKEEYRYLWYLFTEIMGYVRKNRIYGEDPAEEKELLLLAVSCIEQIALSFNEVNQLKKVRLDGIGEFDIKVEDVDVINSEWVNGLLMAAIVRTPDKAVNIAHLSPLLPPTSNNPSNNYFHKYVLLLLEYFKTKNLNKSLYNELNKMKEENASAIGINPLRFDLVTIYLFQPVVEVMKALADNNEKAFNDSLVNALEAHKTFWSQSVSANPGGNPLCREEEGFISFDCTALAAMAYDKGWKIEVESDYMPSYMVNGSFLST